jgi:phosphopantothenoylcysteine decarboxylase/phosphopantothenate--cysteine ligase
VLGVCGGIAAYKSVGLARDLTLAGAAVDTVFTPGAREFVGSITFGAVTGRSVYSEVFEATDPLVHIRLAREAELVVVAPATANFIARAAAGMADDLLSAILLATTSPVLVCPAMNDRMWAHPQTQANIRRLKEIGYHVFGPDEGPLAWGEGSGPGRMEDPTAILDEAAHLLTERTALKGRRVLITAGPTREPIDPVRFIGNRSSGRMGFALAATARRLGAEVTLVAGPSALAAPGGVERVDVETAEQMLHAVKAVLPGADVFVMAAAVADFRPTDPADSKIKKEGISSTRLELERTQDVLRATVGDRKPGVVTVGFALETGNAVESGRTKLEAKELDILVINDASETGAGFEVPTNRVTILDRSGAIEELPLLSKEEVAERIFQRVLDRL